MTQHRTAYDEALDAMLEAGISRGRADELLMAVFEQAQVTREIERKMGIPLESSGSDCFNCAGCHGGELYDFLGHDYRGHRTANALSLHGVRNSEDLKSRSVAWILDNTSVGATLLARIRERVGEAAYKVMETR